MAGQVPYRKNHINKLPNNLEGLDKLIYIIDIQDKKRYEEALDYLKQIIEIIAKIEDTNNTEINVFLHKFDPDLENQDVNINSEDIKKLVSKIKKIIPSEIPLKIQRSSIYTVFQKWNLDEDLGWEIKQKNSSVIFWKLKKHLKALRF